MLDGTGALELLGNMCQRSLLGSYSGWIERRYAVDSFVIDRSDSITFAITDPCPPTIFAEEQTFFPKNSEPYLYLINDSPVIPFNITGGYV